MHYKVTAQYANARELLAESFNDLNKAQQFIKNKMEENIALKLKVIYRLYEWDDLIQEFDPSKMNVAEINSAEGSQGQGRGQGTSFSPSPLATAPRPPGMPHSSFKTNKDEDKNKE